MKSFLCIHGLSPLTCYRCLGWGDARATALRGHVAGKAIFNNGRVRRVSR
jgi:hypothetical protein